MIFDPKQRKKAMRSPRSSRKRHGFSLVELLVVVLILSILMTVAVPMYLTTVHDSQRRVCRANMQVITHLEQAYRLKSPIQGYTSDINAVITDGNLQVPPKCPEGGTYTVDTGPNDAGPITVHCSIVDHDAIPGSANTGYQPGRDSE
jgi:type IV pilus assembly protein PilA